MIKKIINTFASNVLIAVLNLLIAIVVSQYLGAEGKGEQSIIITTIAFILLVCNIVGGATLVYLVPRFDNFKILLPSYLWSLVICVLVYFFIGFFQDIKQVYVFHICLLTLISSLTAVNATILLGNERINTRNIIAIVQTIFLIATLLFMFLFLKQKNIEAYLTSLYISYSAAFILSILFVYKYINIVKEQEASFAEIIKNLFRYGFVNQLSHITQLLSFRLSYYILLMYLGKDSVGIYSNAVALVESVWLISKSIATVQYARIANTEDDSYAQSLTQKLLKSALFVSVFILLPMALLPSVFYKTLFGQEFGQVNYLIIILTPGVFFYNFSLIIGHYFSGKGRYHVNTIASTIGLIITVGLCLLLIPLWGIYGAATAAVFSFIGTSAYVFYVFRKETPYSISSFFPNKNDIKEYGTYFINLISTK